MLKELLIKKKTQNVAQLEHLILIFFKPDYYKK